MKRIGPDERMIQQINKVLEQNAAILKMNALIVDAIMRPPYVTTRGTKLDLTMLRPGEIRMEP